jgi:hypothetical protein
MVTEFDKAIVAAIMAILGILTLWTGWIHGYTEEQILTVVMVLSPILVYLVPNRFRPSTVKQ